MEIPTPNETLYSINHWQRNTYPDATTERILADLNKSWRAFHTAPGLSIQMLEATNLILLLAMWIDSVTDTAFTAQDCLNDVMRLYREKEAACPA